MLREIQVVEGGRRINNPALALSFSLPQRVYVSLPFAEKEVPHCQKSLLPLATKGGVKRPGR